MPPEWPTMDGKRVPWETCQTFSGSWGYHRDESTWKSDKQIITMLIETVSKGGNLLMNVGPTARGKFDDRAKQKLNAYGKWMRLHNRSIYGCTAAPEEFKKPNNCIITFNPKTKRVYVHVLQWPFKYLHLEGYKDKVKYAQLLNDASEINFAQRRGAWMAKEKGFIDNTLTLQLPIVAPDVTVPVIELFLK
jgi:alpha-L-fucosidase